MGIKEDKEETIKETFYEYHPDFVMFCFEDQDSCR